MEQKINQLINKAETAKNKCDEIRNQHADEIVALMLEHNLKEIDLSKSVVTVKCSLEIDDWQTCERDLESATLDEDNELTFVVYNDDYPELTYCEVDNEVYVERTLQLYIDLLKVLKKQINK